MEIKVDDLTGSEVISLIGEHLHGMKLHSPPESIHALGLGELKGPDITFWTVWNEEQLMGCGALKELDFHHGELKSMRTATAHLRKGVAQAMLEHIIKEARKRGYTRLSLETGSMEAFFPARKLYEKYGFVYCPPFGDYIEDQNSVFMTMEL
ncbi:GNAT family N-acetyltransferase [Bacillus sp. ISL-37]|jgi:putative acetyltransferase|uniref:GNAT family N-acetyltransferase n=1 Tax=Bacillus sp. ISL-37 TaxID=2819123 RepID=UPI001BECD62D|nr:GNAT family N-acetyltransferase [Bacillus sp. ISL-37]MBT2684748.1 GNAT family N-acetyltransferase [Bacillus sp. ISL-37]